MPTKRELQERLTASRAEVSRLSELNRDLRASVIAASDKASAKVTVEKRLEVDALVKLLSDRDLEIEQLKRDKVTAISAMQKQVSDRDGEIERLTRMKTIAVSDHTEEVRLRAENDMLRRELGACQSEIDRMKGS
jgi:hypothetical protein